VFLIFPVIKATTEEGTQIRHYVVGHNFEECFSSEKAELSEEVNFARYTDFVSCMQRFPACHNVFYVNDDIIQRVSATSTGGAVCNTNENLRPGFAGAAAADQPEHIERNR